MCTCLLAVNYLCTVLTTFCFPDSNYALPSSDNMTSMLVCFPAAQRIGVVDDIIDGMFEGLLGDDTSDAGSHASRRPSSMSGATPTEKRGLGLRFRRKSSAASVGGAPGPAATPATRAEADAEANAAVDDLLAELDAAGEPERAARAPAAPTARATTTSDPASASARAGNHTGSGWSTPRASVSEAADNQHRPGSQEYASASEAEAAEDVTALPTATGQAQLSDEAQTQDGSSRRISDLLHEAEALVREPQPDAEDEAEPAAEPEPEAVTETPEEAAARRKKEEAYEAAEMARLAKLTMGRKKARRSRPQLESVFRLSDADADADAEAEA